MNKSPLLDILDIQGHRLLNSFLQLKNRQRQLRMASDKVMEGVITEEKRKKEKSKKRKHEEVEDIKEKKVKGKSKKRKQDDTESPPKKKPKKEKSKKEKQEVLEIESQDAEISNMEDNLTPSTNAQLSTPQKKKKTKKAKSLDEDVIMEKSKVESSKAEKKTKKKKTHQEAGGSGDTVADVPEESEGQGKAGKSGRFIVFVGNLPYSATKEALTKHFKKIEPVSIRLLTDRESGKCKGTAFVELENWDRMNTALKLYHHTMFEDGVSKARKINVELSAGGGGKGENRKEKIKQKNDKLYEERRQMQEKKQQESKTDPADGGRSAQADNHGGMHPSRRALIGV